MLRLFVAEEKIIRFGFGMGDSLDLYVIYERPDDYPTKFVVRRHSVVSGGRVDVAKDPEMVCDSLDEARKSIPDGLYRLPRYEQDVLSIVETWL